MANLGMNDNNLNKYNNTINTNNTSNKSQDEKMKPSKGIKKNVIIIISIAIIILMIASGIGYVLNNIGGLFGDDKDIDEKNTEVKLANNTTLNTVDLILPKPKPKPKPKQISEADFKIEKSKKSEEIVEKQPDPNSFAALMNKNGPIRQSSNIPTRKAYDVLKANKSSMLTIHTDVKALEEEEKAEKEAQKKKEAEEKAKREAEMYPYGFTYRFVDGISVKVPNRAPTSLYGNRYSIYGNTASALGNSVFQAKARALKMDLNKDFLLPKGTFIPCSLDTRILTDLAGGVNCTVRDDVYSDNGKVLLIEKGSQVYGFFENGQIKVGMDRVFVIWQEIRTPAGIAIPIDSFAVDELGSSGAVGQIDYHWALRFTSSILVSIMSDVFTNLSTRLADANTTINTDNTQETTETLATETLKRFIDIEPTLLKHQGELVGIYVNKDIDFSDVYELDLADEDE